MSALTDEQRLQAFRNALTGDSSWNAIEAVSYRFDVPARASIVEIVGTGPVDWDDDGDGERSLSLPGGGFSPPSRRQRAPGQDQEAPFYDEPGFNCHATTVRLPSDTRPDRWSYNSTYDTVIYGHLYYRDFERRDASIRMVRGSRTEKPEIEKQQAERDNGRLARFDNSRAWIYYNPGKPAALPAVGSGVPATYDGDWLQQAGACLPPDMRE